MDQNFCIESDDYLQLSALNAFLYCERRAALRHIDCLYVHNEHTLRGDILHTRADTPGTENRESRAKSKPKSGSNSKSKSTIRTERGLWICSRRLRIYGKADLVEFRGEGQAPSPVEYKRGRYQQWDNDDVQLCAQALCLEETLGVSVPEGAIYHAQSQKRRTVVFDNELRAKTERTIERLRELLRNDRVPPAELTKRCRGCSLRGHCLPEVFDQGQKKRLDAYKRNLFSPSLSEPRIGS